MRAPPPERLIAGTLETPVGEASVITDEAGRLRFFDWADFAPRRESLGRRFYPRGPQVEAGEIPAGLRTALDAYFGGELAAIDNLPCALPGTEFQRRVWAALCEIPVGQTISYGELARRVGSPGGMRAAGQANGANPIGVVVPCHRVIAADRTLGGYGGGLARKRWLLRHEGATFRDRAGEVETAPLF